MEESIFIRTAVLDSHLLQTELAEMLRRAVTMGDTHRVTDQLKLQDVDTLHFDLANDGRFRITPVGLKSGGGRSPTLRVEATVRIIPGSGAETQARVGIEVGLTRGSWVGLLRAPVLLTGLGVAQLVEQPPSFGSFFLLLGVACVFAAVGLVRAHDLVGRAWPGLLAVAQRIATGSLYVPAA